VSLRFTNTDPALRRAWHAVARRGDVGADPISVTLLGEQWALARLPDRTRGPDGTVLAAFLDRCPHRLAPLSAGWVDGDVLRCGYHGWCFASDGRCTEIPSMESAEHLPPRAKATTPAGLAERHGMVFLAAEPPVTELLDLPVYDDPSFLRGELPVIRASVGAGLMLDNFLDMAHFPFVHVATIGAPEPAQVESFDIERRRHGMTVRSHHPFPNHEDPAVKAGTRPLLQHRRLVYEYRAPFHISLEIEYVEAGGRNVLGFWVQPEDDSSCRIFTTVMRNDLDGDEHRLAEAVSFEQKIVEEDLRVQERYRDKSLPLDLTTEVHTTADKVTVELRRILRGLIEEES
jgi:phenylpropionate dioxygenase-like ring-hydroxylating dioxygenase large terminal subunit